MVETERAAVSRRKLKRRATSEHGRKKGRSVRSGPETFSGGVYLPDFAAF